MDEVLYIEQKIFSSCITTKSNVVMGDNLVEATSLGPNICQHSNSYKLPSGNPDCSLG